MKDFLDGIAADLGRIGWRAAAFLAFAVVAVYGMPAANPSTAYDFNAAKGDALQVFLTYFFMRRFMQGAIAALFHDFSPMWNWAVGLFALFAFANLLVVLARRIGLSRRQAVAFAALWLSAPFFYNRSVYQHAMPAEAVGFCIDAAAILLFAETRKPHPRRDRLKFAAASALCAGASLSVYQAHANLLLTAMLGVCWLVPARTWRGWRRGVFAVVAVLGAGVAVWALANWGPILAAKLAGVTFPKSGGAHDAVYWFDGALPFRERLAGLFAGIALNWVYNAFFVVGLRWVILSFAFALAAAVRFALAGRRIEAASALLFALSVFAMPAIQCSSSNLRIFWCFFPLIAFSGAAAMRGAEGRRRGVRIASIALVAFAVLSLAHETATLYYYNWKVKTHDALHMGNVATDVWRKCGVAPDKPVAVIGGWPHYPACWEDMRPNRDMPLLNHPFTTYSNMTDGNVPREFYMVAREKVGLVVDMPPDDAYGRAKGLVASAPAYPQDGYVFEADGMIVVNLGERSGRWRRFDFKSFRSPNEKLLFKTIGEDGIDALKRRLARPFLALASRHPWVLEE